MLQTPTIVVVIVIVAPKVSTPWAPEAHVHEGMPSRKRLKAVVTILIVVLIFVLQATGLGVLTLWVGGGGG